MLNSNCLLSGGVTTDICVYKLYDGRFKDQFGKNSAQQKVQEKVRHVAPFPFSPVAVLSGAPDLLFMKSGTGRSIEVYSTKTHKQLMRLDKKGDYLIKTFDAHQLENGMHALVFSDCKDT
jgi:hypothetical protein